MNATVSKTDQLIAESQALIEEGKQLLAKEGKVINLSHWLTIKRYCEKYDIKSTSVVSNWIERGIVPAEDVIQLEELNGLKLIKDKSYKDSE